MIVIGDISCPNPVLAKCFQKDIIKSGIFEKQAILCNLEGLIRNDEPYSDSKLFNCEEVLNSFDPERTVFSIANNHTYDYPELIESTVQILEKKGYGCVGRYTKGLIEPCILESGNTTYAIFAHCWKMYTRTNKNTINNEKIVDCAYEAFFDEVIRYTVQHREQRVICYFHWNYDMEILPFPMHRTLSKDLIDHGVFAVIGNHSHVTQGGELYKGAPIIYGLGNFYMPSKLYFDGKLTFPEISKKAMAFEIDDNTGEFKCHWFVTDGADYTVNKISSESFIEGKIINSESPYRNMNDKDYKVYFKKNRKKGFLVPVFDRYKGSRFALKEKIGIARIKLIKLIKD